MDQIINRARVEGEARTAARTHTNVNDCCPYPFGSAAGMLYASEFAQERDWLTRGISPRQQANPQASA